MSKVRPSRRSISPAWTSSSSVNPSSISRWPTCAEGGAAPMPKRRIIKARQSALLQVVKNRGTFRLPSEADGTSAPPCGWPSRCAPERAALFIGRVVLHLGQGHVKLIRQKGHRLRKGQALNVHDKLDHAAAGFAAEAVIDLPLPVHGNEGAVLPKRAQTNISMPVLLQRHIRADHLDDVGARPELVQTIAGDTFRPFVASPTPIHSPPRVRFLPYVQQFPTFLLLRRRQPAHPEQT